MRRPPDPTAALVEQRGYLFLWAPVFFAIGIGLWFGLPWEPSRADYLLLTVGGVLALAAAMLSGPRISPLLWALTLVAAGFGNAGFRAHWVAEPVLGWRYYGPVEGRIVEIDRSRSEAVRLTLDRVVLERVSPERTPARVRVSLHGTQGYIDPVPGLTVMMSAHLSPPPGPPEPGGFDFRRNAWFDRLGAVGYTRSPVLALAPASEGAAGLAIYRLRRAIGQGVQSHLPGERGGLATAILTGDRSGIPQATLEDLRASNLAHLLAISGLHMGLLTAFVFGLVRGGLSFVPYVALRWPTKKIAAVVAIGASAAYLAISGGSVATERAFVMVTVMLAGILFDRRALTLRAVAIAALIVLALRPEALLGPGFQMSFAATTALVATFGALRHWQATAVPRWMQGPVSLFLSSSVAGAATAPIAAAHFNQIAQFGLLANLLSVPLMGLAVMPAAVVAALLWPLGLAGLGLWVMGLGIAWILGVAHWVAGFEHALRHVWTPDGLVLPIMAGGMLFVILWRLPSRALGLAPVVAAFVLWAMTDRPALLISDSGGMIGLLTPQGRDLSRERGEGFAADTWLENDGAPVEQAAAFARDGLQLEAPRVWRAELAGLTAILSPGRAGPDRVDGCAGADILILSVEDDRGRPCLVLDATKLRATGSIAVFEGPDGVRLLSAAEASGQRLWTGGGAQGGEGPQVLALRVDGAQ